MTKMVMILFYICNITFSVHAVHFDKTNISPPRENRALIDRTNLYPSNLQIPEGNFFDEKVIEQSQQLIKKENDRQQPSLLLSLPRELLFIVINHLDAISRVRSIQTCHDLKNCVETLRRNKQKNISLKNSSDRNQTLKKLYDLCDLPLNAPFTFPPSILTNLCFSRIIISPEHIETLLKQSAEQLQQLELEALRMESFEKKILLDILKNNLSKFNSLNILNLSKNYFDAEDMKKLTLVRELPFLAKLETLNLSGNYIPSQLWNLFIDNLKSHATIAMKRFYGNFTNAKDGSYAFFLAYMVNKSDGLEILDVSNQLYIPSNSSAIFFEALKSKSMKKLKILKMANWNITDDNFAILISPLSSEHKTSAINKDLFKNKILDPLKVSKLDSLEELDMSFNHLTSKSLENLFLAFWNNKFPRLTKLYLNQVGLTENEMNALTPPFFLHLRSLSLSGTRQFDFLSKLFERICSCSDVLALKELKLASEGEIYCHKFEFFLNAATQNKLINLEILSLKNITVSENDFSSFLKILSEDKLPCLVTLNFPTVQNSTETQFKSIVNILENGHLPYISSLSLEGIRIECKVIPALLKLKQDGKLQRLTCLQLTSSVADNELITLFKKHGVKINVSISAFSHENL